MPLSGVFGYQYNRPRTHDDPQWGAVEEGFLAGRRPALSRRKYHLQINITELARTNDPLQRGRCGGGLHSRATPAL